MLATLKYNSMLMCILVSAKEKWYLAREKRNTWGMNLKGTKVQ